MSRRLLIVDDESLFARPFARMLRPHEVRFFDDPVAALAHLEIERGYDVVLCDVMMPGLLGPELHARVAALDPGLAGRFVFLTGGVFSRDTQAYLTASGRPQLTKPFERDELLDLVDRVARGER